MPKIDPADAEVRSGSGYPSPYDQPCQARSRQQLGNVAGLTQFGVNRLTLPPGCWSSQRHWHSAEDEFVMVLSGEVVLIDDSGETVLKAGDFAGFRCGEANGHHLVNRSGADAVVLEVGTRADDTDACVYPDVDMAWPSGADRYHHVDGTPYPAPPP